MISNHGLHGLAALTLACSGMAWAAFAAEPTISVEARQRYPWNGLVDINFTITGEAGTRYYTSFAADDVVGGTNIAMQTIRKSEGSLAVAREALLPGSYKWVWDAAADLPRDWMCDRVTVTGTAFDAFPYSVKFNANGGTGTMSNESFTYGTAKALTANAFKRTGYTFQGWATSASGAKVYNDKQSVGNLATSSGEIVNLYAVWKAALYMVIDLSGGPSASSYPVNYLTAVPSGGWSDTYKTTKLVLRRVEKGSNSAGGSMSKDMWVGVFEVTAKQYNLVEGRFICYYAYNSIGNYDSQDFTTCAIGCISNRDDFGGRPSEFLADLKKRTGVKARLATKTEWQYVCRAGTTTDYNNGTSATAANMAKIGWSSENIGKSKNKPAIVGLFTPNAWGLYDMHGGQREKTAETKVTETGAKPSGSYSGGSFHDSYSGCKVSAQAWAINPDEQNGFRVFADVE